MFVTFTLKKMVEKHEVLVLLISGGKQEFAFVLLHIYIHSFTFQD